MKRFTSERVVVTWNGPVAGAAHEAEGGYRKAVAELYHDLIEQFEHIDLLQFSAGKCVMRTVVMEGEDLLVIRERICAALSERGIDNATVGVVDVDNGTPLTDQLRQYATLSEDTAFTDAADEIEKSRALIKRLRQQLRKASRYKAAATALWKLLDDIDTADDAAREDDARYRAIARTIAKRRSEHAVSFDGQTLVWSWDSPLPAADFAKLEVKALEGKATDDEIAEYKRLVALHEPSPELIIVQDEPAPCRLGTFERKPIDSVGALMPEGFAGYAPHEPRKHNELLLLPLIKALYPPLPDFGSKDDDEPDDGFAPSDTDKLLDDPDVMGAVDPALAANWGKGVTHYVGASDPQDFVAIALPTVAEAKQCQNCRHVQMHPDGEHGRCARSPAAMPKVAPADTCEHWRSQKRDLFTEDGHVEHVGDGQPTVLAGIEPLPINDPEVVTVSQFAAQFGVAAEHVTVKDGKFSVAIPTEGGTLYTCPEQKPTPADVANALEAVDPANPDFAPALALLADAELPIDDGCPECNGTGEQPGPDPFNPPCENCSSEADDG